MTQAPFIIENTPAAHTPREPNHSYSLPEPFQQDFGILKNSVDGIFLPPAILSLKGKDVLEFLHRLTTNDVKQIAEGSSGTTILINEKAKIIDICTVLHLQEEILLVLESNETAKIMQWLDRFLFSEDVNIQNVSGEYEHLLIPGDPSTTIIQSNTEDGKQQTTSAIVPFKNNGVEGILFRDSLWHFPVYQILIKKIAGSSFDEWLQASGIHTIVPASIEDLRIEQGVPKFGHELSEKVNPLEAGLDRFISWTKGCYIGQEVIARIDTYKKLQRTLSGFIIEAAEETPMLPGKLFLNNEEVGWTTSHTWSSKLKKHIALGYLKTNLQVNVVEFVGENFTNPVQAILSPLPFPTTQ